MQASSQSTTHDRSLRLAFVSSVIVGLLAVIVGSYRLDDWRYFLVGDEYGFYPAAELIVQRKFAMNPFASGIHVMNYMAVSFYQALFLAVKRSFWMWRFSNIILFLPICVLVYTWGRIWFTPRVGLYSAIFVSTSFFLHNYFLIGYPNPLAVLFLCALHVAWGAWSRRDSMNFLAALGLGTLSGVAFYVYLGPILIPSVAPYVVYRVWRSEKRMATLGCLVLAALPCLAIIKPGVFDSDAIAAMTRVTSRSPEFSDRYQIILNIRNCFRIFWWNPRASHFIVGPYLDQITLCCFIAGLLSLLITRSTGAILLVTSFSLLAALIGGTSPYAYPAITRGVVFIPFGCLAAGVGFDWVTRRLPQLGRIVSVVALASGLVLANRQRAEAFVNSQWMPPDIIFMRDLMKTLKTCPTATTVRAYYPSSISLQNNLPNLSFFITVQAGRPITIERAAADNPNTGRQSDAVCEFHFTPTPEELKAPSR